LLSLNSGYVLRAAASLPKQAGKKPWLIRQNYILDTLTMKLGRMEDGILKFGSAVSASRAAVPEEIASVSAGDD
jgi:hypothetical protein